MNRRTVTLGAAVAGMSRLASSHASSNRAGLAATPPVDPLKDAFQWAYRQLELTQADSEKPLQIDSWAIGFMHHPSTRGRYRSLKSEFVEGTTFAPVNALVDGVDATVGYRMPERSDVIAEFSATVVLADAETPTRVGAMILTQNGGYCQMIVLQPSASLDEKSAVDMLESIAHVAHLRAPDFIARGELTREATWSKVLTRDDALEAAAEVVVRSERYEYIYGEPNF